MLYKLTINNLQDNYIAYADLESLNAKLLTKAIQRNWVAGANSISIPYWSKQVGNSFLNKYTFALSQAGVITSSVRRNFGSISLNQKWIDQHMSSEEQLAFRKQSRLQQYLLRKAILQRGDLTSTPSGIRETGLVRNGLAYSASNLFQFDTNYMLKYRDSIVLSATKSLDKVAEKYPHIREDKANYGLIAEECIDYYLCHPDEWYNMEANINDQRGRAIYKALKRVLNPVTSKDARSLLIIPGITISLTDTIALNDIYIFIAELAGHKCEKWDDKPAEGIRCYESRLLHNLDLSNADDRRELHENIWLERIYDKLDTLFEDGEVYWDIPLEADWTASICAIEAILTNDSILADETNVINPDNLKDIWTVPDLDREKVKSVMTPRLYGSSASPRALMTNKKLEPTTNDIKLANIMLRDGKFRVANAFKDFFIKNANFTTPTVTIDMWDEQFEVEISRFKPAGADISAYTAYDTEASRTKVFINHESIRIPDYERFSLWSCTGLV